jgi:hypothetical protein
VPSTSLRITLVAVMVLVGFSFAIVFYYAVVGSVLVYVFSYKIPDPGQVGPLNTMVVNRYSAYRWMIYVVPSAAVIVGISVTTLLGYGAYKVWNMTWKDLKTSFRGIRKGLFRRKKTLIAVQSRLKQQTS